VNMEDLNKDATWKRNVNQVDAEFFGNLTVEVMILLLVSC
jgi:hypothetical protein